MNYSNILLAASMTLLLTAALAFAGTVNASPIDQAAFDDMQEEYR